jgi:glucosylceramidase
MRSPLFCGLSLCLLCLFCATAPAQQGKAVAVWLTTADRSSLLAKQAPSLKFQKHAADQASTIQVDDSKTFQSLDGFGFALTGGSAELLMKMDKVKRHELLQELFSRGPNAVGVSYLRVSIGASDMNDHVFTYDDMPLGEQDPDLQRFNLNEDLKDVVPVLREVLAISPRLKILASPWTAPSWMKTVDAPKGGSLKPEFYKVYAQYLVKYIQAMQTQGIHIDAITPQNEPLNPKNTPSMVMQAGEQAAFVKQALGPAFHQNAITTRIILYDHNCDQPDYPLTILNDPDARKYVDGSGFHLYGGSITAMTQVHDAFQDKNLYFTEQMIIDNQRGRPHAIAESIQRVVIGATRNWSRNVLLWNLAADPKFGPHTNDGGCPICQGAITLDGDNVQRNIAYYTIAQLSKFVPPNSVRIDSTEPTETFSNVAFRTPDKHTVLLVTNTGTEKKSFNVVSGQRSFIATLDAGSVATYVW